jgi:hypothetical protein
MLETHGQCNVKALEQAMHSHLCCYRLELRGSSAAVVLELSL